MKKLFTLVLAVWALGLTAADSAVSTAADWRPSVRWRGFNLTEMFIKSWPGAQPKEFREEDFAFMKKWGFNFARLPMDYRFWIKNGDWNVFDEDHLKYIDRALALGKKYGVHINICMHRAPGYTVARPAEPTNLFTDPETQRVCARHWAMFARRYKGIPNENLSFNLFNEPANVKDEVYASVAKLLIAAIHREDPNRFILADGLQWGSKPARKLVGLCNVGQSTRGYAPHGVSHYLAPWAGAPSAKPVWPPVQDAPSGILAGSGKPELRGSFVFCNLPAGTATFSYGKVSGRVVIRYTADGETAAEVALEPKDNAPDWTDVKWYPQWNIHQGAYLGHTAFPLPHGAKKLEVRLVAGDWAYLTSFALQGKDGTRAICPIAAEWHKPAHAVQLFCGFTAVQPFAAADKVRRRPRYADPGQDYLYRQQLAAWDEVRAAGTFVMAGEFGVWKKTPHAIVLDLVEDYLVLWKERNMGWAMWNLRGEFGILDSNRADVVYEEYNGHKLDRKLLDLLLKY